MVSPEVVWSSVDINSPHVAVSHWRNSTGWLIAVQNNTPFFQKYTSKRTRKLAMYSVHTPIVKHLVKKISFCKKTVFWIHIHILGIYAILWLHIRNQIQAFTHCKWFEMKAQWESNIIVSFGSSFTFKQNQKLTTRMNCFHLWSVIFQIGNLYVCHLNSWLNRRSGGKGRELPTTTACQQFPALLSASVALENQKPSSTSSESGNSGSGGILFVRQPVLPRWSAMLAKYPENARMLGSSHSTVLELPNPGILHTTTL